MKPLFQMLTILLIILNFSSCQENYKAKYLKLKSEKEENSRILDRHFKSVSIESEYESQLNRILAINHIKEKNYQNNGEIFFAFDIFPPFNQNRKIYIISNSDNVAYFYEIIYNLKLECNSIIGNKALDKSCLTTYQIDSFPLNAEDVDTLIRRLDYYEFWNLSENTYNSNEFVVFDGFTWRMKGIKGTNFDFPDSIYQYENKIYRKLPQYYSSISNIGDYIKSLKNE